VPGEQADGILPQLTESIDGSNLSTLPTIFPFLHFLLNDPVRLALLNYGLLAFLDAAFRVLLPLFLVISIASYPFFTGDILATMGLVGFLVQAILFAPVHRLLGSRPLYLLGLCSFGILFATFAFIVKADSKGPEFLSSSGSALIALQMVLYPIARMPFRKHILPLEHTSGLIWSPFRHHVFIYRRPVSIIPTDEGNGRYCSNYYSNCPRFWLSQCCLSICSIHAETGSDWWQSRLLCPWVCDRIRCVCFVDASYRALEQKYRGRAYF
jgi:hypothetical protein